MKSKITAIRNIFLDILFPRSAILKRIEKMSIAEISETVPKAEFIDKNIFAVLDYSNEIAKTIIWELKYRKNNKFAETLGALLYEKIVLELSEPEMITHFDDPILIPIPLSKGRFRERGFNQTDLICKEICKLDTSKYFEYRPDMLIKTRNTASQSRTKSKKERLNNLKGCFEVPLAAREYARGRNIILIDDVYTTGATTTEASRILRNAGAKRIIIFTVAH